MVHVVRVFQHLKNFTLLYVGDVIDLIDLHMHKTITETETNIQKRFQKSLHYNFHYSFFYNFSITRLTH
jgi:hypothetical protein